MFDESPIENDLISSGVFEGEKVLKARWMKKVEEIIGLTNLNLPDWNSLQPVFGGRTGKHSEHLQPLLDEMAEVFKIDPAAEW